MTTRIHSITASAAIASLIAFAPMAAARTAASVTAAQEARETLKEMKGIAAAAAEEADPLELYGSVLSPGSHLARLFELKQDVNTMGKEIARLEAERDSLEPWEQQAIDKVLPLLKDAAENTQSAIGFFNENRGHLWSPDYRTYTEKIERDSRQIARTLKDYLKFEKVREQEQKLQTAVEAGGN